MTPTDFSPDRIDVFHLEATIATPRRNAFGTMHARPALLVRMTDKDGATGWGEAFCNWPAFGARHRKRIIEDILAPVIAGRTYASPEAMWMSLTEATRRIAIQANEPGPFEQTIAALDIAAWDLVARRAGQPLFRLLGPGAGPVGVYASALTADTLDTLVPPLLSAGWRAFKVKVGFGIEADMRVLDQLQRLAPVADYMVDANQKWSRSEALDFMRAVEGRHLSWIEEPLPADAPPADWIALEEASSCPLAAGENVRGDMAFSTLAGHHAVRVLQPDAIKWGGMSGLLRVAAIARAHGLVLAPHYLGSGLGLMATAHACVALGAAWLEVDVSENPLRDALFDATCFVSSGDVHLSTEGPGLGVVPEPSFLDEYGVTSK